MIACREGNWMTQNRGRRDKTAFNLNDTAFRL